MSWTSMFNQAIFQVILLTSAHNINDYVVHIYSKYAELDRNNKAELVDLDDEKLHNQNNLTNRL